jgi:hypothetical protein
LTPPPLLAVVDATAAGVVDAAAEAPGAGIILAVGTGASHHVSAVI